MPSHVWFALALAVGLAVAVVLPAADQSLTYPPTHRVDHVDDYHGTKVADPYRWLEEDVRSSKEVADWVAAEHLVTEAYLAAIPQREAVKKRLTELWNFERYSTPRQAGEVYLYSLHDGLQKQSVR